MWCPYRNFNFHPEMRYYPVVLNGQGERGYVLWQTCYKCRKFVICLKQTKSLFEPPYEIDDSDILVLKTFAEAKHNNAKHMIDASTQTKSKKVKIMKSKNV
jgi:hypothetical protein